MALDYLGVGVKIFDDILSSRRTGESVEKELDQHFGNLEEVIESHTDKQVRLELESIRVRPKYRNKKVSEGVWQAEFWAGFSEYDEEREKPTLSERCFAIANDDWITVIRFNIRDGTIEDLKPPGLNLSFVTTRLGLYDTGRQFKPVETSEVQPDKLKMKIPYNGSIGEYRQNISEAVDSLRYIQDNMESEILFYLIELMHGAEVDESVESDWSSEDRAKKLGEYLVGHPVDMKELADIVRGLKNRLEASADVSNQDDTVD